MVTMSAERIEGEARLEMRIPARMRRALRQAAVDADRTVTAIVTEAIEQKLQQLGGRAERILRGEDNE